jgi:hypothetical protein
MEKNVGKSDGIIRLILGVILIIVGFGYLSGVVGVIVIIIGVALIITSFTKFCFTYKLFGINTLDK